MTRKVVPVIEVKDVLNLLKQGYSRYEKDNKGFGSIQATYGLSAYSVTKLFRDTPMLKNKKTVAPAFIVKDTDENETDTAITAAEIKEEILSSVNTDNEVFY